VEPRDIVPIILWPWFLVSVFVLIRRSFRKRSGTGTPPATSPTSPVPPAPPNTVGSPSSGARGVGRPAWSADTPLPAAPPPTPGPPPAAPVLPEGASIFDPPSDLPPTPPRATIAEMVEGIQLPCDLTPLVGAMRPIGARESVAFVTRTADATSVGRAVGEELRRLGFELTTRHATEVVATRGDDWLIVAVHPDGATAERSGERAFPNAGPGSVVVELWTE